MAKEAKKFDLYLGDEKVQEGVASPIEITGLKPSTKYDYALAYAGVDAKAPFSFTTDAAPTTTTTTSAPVQPSTTTSTTSAPVQPSTTTSTTAGA